MVKYPLLMLFFFSFVQEVGGQVLKNKTNLGLFLRPSFTQATTTGGLTVLDDHSFLTAGMGLYSLFRIRSEPARIPIYFIKAELGLSSRAGVFEISGFGPVRITSSVIDASLTVPLTVEVTETLRANVGLGGSLGYQISSQVESDSGVPPNLSQSSFRPGFILDVGFLVDDKSTALFGVRALVETVDLGYAEIGMYMGFGIRRKAK